MTFRGTCSVVPLLAVLSLTAVPVWGQSRDVDCDAIFDRPGHGQTFYESNPTYLDPAGIFEWPISTPGDQGMDAVILDAGLAELTATPSVLSVLVLRHGKLIAERYAHGGGADHANNIHSASKSILSALTGIAIHEGYIDSVDQKVADFLPLYFADGDAVKAQLTIAHLLTMSAGLAWTEDVTEYQIESDHDWVRAVLAHPSNQTPGESFHYSTGLTHVLSAVLTAATGMSTCDFAHRYLLGPLGVTTEHWGRDPQGINSGGYNVYLTPREMAAFGQLYLQGGRWRDVQVVPSSWVAESLRPHQTDDDTYSYGYLWWLRDVGGHATAIAWGWGGQLIYVMPSLDIVVVVTTDTADNDPDVDAIEFVRDVVIAAAP